MTFTTDCSLLKLSWVSVVLAAAILTSGCNKASTEPEAKVDDTATSQAIESKVDGATPQTTVAAPAVNEEPYVMTTLGLDSVNNLVFMPLISGDKLTAEQKTCLESRDKNLGQTELQGFYKSQFSEAQLNELDKFYSSNVGVKMIAAGKEEMLLRNGQEVANPMAAPTPDEITEIQTFMQTPTGSKYAQMNMAVGEGSALSTLDKPIDAEFKRCNIDLTMATLMQPIPTAG